MEQQATHPERLSPLVDALLATALDVTEEGILLVRSDQTVVYANQAYARILGVPLHRILGKNLHDVEPGAAILQVLKDGRPRLHHHEMIRSLGVEIIANVIPLYADGQVTAAIAVFSSVETALYFRQALIRTQSYSAYLEKELAKCKGVPPFFSGLIGKNTRFVRALRLAAKAAETDVTVFIRGETGVGKDILAEAIHNASARKNGPFVRVNCAAVPETLLESELFGFEEGSFTGARKGGQPGKFELAHTGTLFLDEAGTMSAGMQAKLLRVIEKKDFQRIGGRTTHRVDVRLVAATNTDMEAAVKGGEFRQDLYYRLHIFPIALPPLRDRRDDILVLADYFLKQFHKKYGKDLQLSREVVELLLEHPWPGNVRELINVIEFAHVACEGSTIRTHHLPPYFRDIEFGKRNPEDVAQLLASNTGLQDIVAQFEGEAIRQALEITGNNRSKAMRLLKLSRPAFYQKLHKYGMQVRP